MDKTEYTFDEREDFCLRVKSFDAAMEAIYQMVQQNQLSPRGMSNLVWHAVRFFIG